MFNFSDQFQPHRFIREYWQKKPAVIRQAFVDFDDPLSPDELAGMALEDEVESRLISNQSDDWQVQCGPIDDYESFGESHWTLLVQGAEQWHPDVEVLLRRFNFVPNWRLDDVMISFSAPKGGVGPHVDQYDVFIIQGQGKRHWRIGLPQASSEVITNQALRQVEQFEACIDVILEPGDMIYIPPNHPHEGYAIEPSLNYSIGFRAPNQKELLSACADAFLDNDWGKTRYQDPDLEIRNASGEITDNEIAKLQGLLFESIDNKSKFIEWFGKSNTESKSNLYTEEIEFSCDDFASLTEDTQVSPIEGLRTMYANLGNSIALFINGEQYFLSQQQQDLAEILCSNKPFMLSDYLQPPFLLENQELLATLISNRLLIIED